MKTNQINGSCVFHMLKCLCWDQSITKFFCIGGWLLTSTMYPSVTSYRITAKIATHWLVATNVMSCWVMNNSLSIEPKTMCAYETYNHMALGFSLTTRHLYNPIMFDDIKSHNESKHCCLQYEMIEVWVCSWYIRCALNNIAFNSKLLSFESTTSI